MHLLRFIWRPRWFVDEAVLRREGSRQQGRELTYRALELGSNNFSVTLVGALGFFTGTYVLFSSNIALPMLGYVYWHDTTTASHETAFNNATLGGCMLGMVFFGICADLFGRKRVYGYELIALTVGTMGLITSSAGYVSLGQVEGQEAQSVDYSSLGSMNIFSWLWFWRFVSGIGIGGEYPLSGVIASEFAPTAKRAQILATVFSMQAFGVAASAIVSLAVTSIVEARHPYDSARPEASARAVDQIWRWVIGLSLIPAVFTSVLRFTIPESPRYTLDVRDNPIQASEDAQKLRNTEMLSSSITQALSRSKDAEKAADVITIRSGGGSTDTSSVSIKQYFWTEGNWRYLFGTALCWLLLDLASFAEDLNNASVLSKIWGGPLQDAHRDLRVWNSTSRLDAVIFDVLRGNDIHLLLLESVAWITGNVVLILFITRINRKLLTWCMFLVSGTLFIITGAMLARRSASNWGINTMLYALIKFSNAFGVGPLTFIIPAELFPTKYRASCHGISAASGKFGAILRSLIVHYVEFRHVDRSDPNSAWLGYVLIIGGVPMLLGALVCWIWIPNVQDQSGRNRTLEELAEGRKPQARQTTAGSSSP